MEHYMLISHTLEYFTINQFRKRYIGQSHGFNRGMLSLQNLSLLFVHKIIAKIALYTIKSTILV